METFKTPKWDASGDDETYKELFEKNKKDYKTIKKGKKLKEKLKLKRLIKQADRAPLIQNQMQEKTGKSRKKSKVKLKLAEKLQTNPKPTLNNARLKDTTHRKKLKETVKVLKQKVVVHTSRKKAKVKLNVTEKSQINTKPPATKVGPNDPHRQKKLKRMVEVLKQKVAVDKYSNTVQRQPENSTKQVSLKEPHTHQKSKGKKPVLTLRQKMMEKLKAARFRFLNEQIYTTNSKEAQKIFKSDPDAFEAYHDGYRQQVQSWPLNPVDSIIKSIKKLPMSYVIADFGCGDAKITKSVEHKVHSFDLVAIDETVTACDMSRVPLEANSVDVVVFCLSLMGTNLNDYILEANRVLKMGGMLKIAEVESRFEDLEVFVKSFRRFGFKNVWKDLSHNLFYFLDFTKISDVKSKKKLPDLKLLPCLYKKR